MCDRHAPEYPTKEEEEREREKKMMMRMMTMAITVMMIAETATWERTLSFD